MKTTIMTVVKMHTNELLLIQKYSMTMKSLGAHNGKECPTSITIRCRVDLAAHNTPYMDLNCSRLRSVYVRVRLCVTSRK